ncbi:MAG: DNA replication and repair protein RecF [Spirochaetes bacterium]|nr:DNA replication and repair protein RecF [Spirochaetota bacterium]
MIKNLNLVNFRNYQKAAYTFSNGLIFITGDNGAGKTTILEAIGIVSFLKSFRLAHDKEMLRFDAPFYRIEAEYASLNESHSVAIAYGKNPEVTAAPAVKKYSFDGRVGEKAANIIGKVATVVLSPDDMNIIAGDHTERRRFLDLLLSMLYPAYFSALQHYHRALKLRSQALKARPDEGVLAAIDRELAGAGLIILERRREFIPEFATPFADAVAKISGARDEWCLAYRGDTERVASLDDYLSLLKDRRANDLRLKQTTAGIHRDRLYFHAGDGTSDNREIRMIGSQGQKRTAALALKMAQFAYMRARSQTTPILLIDDILNELDVLRRAQFIDFLGSAAIGQVFFTTTDLIGVQDFLGRLEKTSPIQNIELF